MGKKVRFKHCANIGDLLAALPSIKRYYELNGKKVTLCQQIDVEASYYQDADHPTKKGNKKVMCNEEMLEMMRPLLTAQEYIEDVEVFGGQKVDVDLDVIRNKTFVNLPYGMIQSWVGLAYVDLAPDLSEAWINVEANEVYKDKIVINLTERYRNRLISYFFLKEHQKNLIFAGTEEEHNFFCEDWRFNIPRLFVNNFLELAQIIKGCKFFIGNQSFCWGLAESLKSPRILEMCQAAPNCQPFIGKFSHGFYHQTGLEYAVEYFNKNL